MTFQFRNRTQHQCCTIIVARTSEAGRFVATLFVKLEEKHYSISTFSSAEDFTIIDLLVRYWYCIQLFQNVDVNNYNSPWKSYLAHCHNALCPLITTTIMRIKIPLSKSSKAKDIVKLKFGTRQNNTQMNCTVVDEIKTIIMHMFKGGNNAVINCAFHWQTQQLSTIFQATD